MAMREVNGFWCAVAMGAALVFASGAHGEGSADPLPRRGCLGAQVVGAADGVIVVGVVADGPAQRAGIEALDAIVAIDGVPIADTTPAGYLRGRGEGDAVSLTVRRSGADRVVAVTLAAPRTPDLPGALTEFGEAVLPSGERLRTIKTVPFRAGEHPKPAVLFIQHTDCATIDPEVDSAGAWDDLVQTVAQSGYATMRIDKPGVGDSEGGECPEMDFWTEVDVFRAALASLLADSSVDPTRVFIVATRGGTTIAPILAREVDVAGVCVFSPVVRPWFEHTLGNLRRQSVDWAMAPMQAEKMLHDCGELLARVIVIGQSPTEVAAEHEELAALVRSLGGDRLFGRCAAFHQQLNDADVAAAWAMAETNVLVLRGEYDRYSIAADQDLVARLVNGPTGSRAWTATIAKTDPDMNPQPGPDYYKAKWSSIAQGPNPELRETVLDWMEYAMANLPRGTSPAALDPNLQAERDEAGKPES
jgi:hypothetical protein